MGTTKPFFRRILWTNFIDSYSKTYETQKISFVIGEKWRFGLAVDQSAARWVLWGFNGRNPAHAPILSFREFLAEIKGKSPYIRAKRSRDRTNCQGQTTHMG